MFTDTKAFSNLAFASLKCLEQEERGQLFYQLDERAQLFLLVRRADISGMSRVSRMERASRATGSTLPFA